MGRMSEPTALEAASESSGQEEEDLLSPSGRSRRATRLHLQAATAIVGVGLLALGVLACHHALRPSAPSAPTGGPVSVRSLLEGEELADLAAKNIVVMSGARVDGVSSAGREQVRERVRRSFQVISDAIRSKHPESHRRLEALQLTGEQQEASLRVLRKYGDPRMVSLTRDVAEATRQIKQENGDSAVLQRRLSDTLLPRIREMQELGEEMFPGRTFSFDAGAVPQLGKWHPKIEVALSGEAVASPEMERRRLLGTDDGFERSVQVQAQTLFESLHQELGDAMPEAPARMLSSFFDDSSSSSSGQPQESKLGFMDCCMKAVPNPMEVAKCMADNMSEVMSMLTSFMNGGSSNSR